MDSNPYSPPVPPEQRSIDRNWPVALATFVGIVAAIALAVVTFVLVLIGVFQLLVNAGGVHPVMATLVSLGVGLIAAFGMLVSVVRLTFRLLEQHSEE